MRRIASAAALLLLLVGRQPAAQTVSAVDSIGLTVGDLDRARDQPAGLPAALP